MNEIEQAIRYIDGFYNELLKNSLIQLMTTGRIRLRDYPQNLGRTKRILKS